VRIVSGGGDQIDESSWFWWFLWLLSLSSLLRFLRLKSEGFLVGFHLSEPTINIIRRILENQLWRSVQNFKSLFRFSRTRWCYLLFFIYDALHFEITCLSRMQSQKDIAWFFENKRILFCVNYFSFNMNWTIRLKILNTYFALMSRFLKINFFFQQALFVLRKNVNTCMRINWSIIVRLSMKLINHYFLQEVASSSRSQSSWKKTLMRQLIHDHKILIYLNVTMSNLSKNE
jgi:hypothetical protein